MPNIDKDTQLCMSLAGRPGNFGTRFHNHLYGALGLNFVYKAFTTNDLPAAVGGIRALGIRGCAVSMPFKEEVIALVDELMPSAAAIESVNTIVNDSGFLRAYNTDYQAVQQLVERHLLDPQADGHAARVIIRGSGGMAKAVASAFRDAGFKNGVIAARNATTGVRLAEACGYEWQPEAVPGDILVNVTPIGMTGGPEATALSYPANLIEQAKTVFDVVALPPETPLIQEARRQSKAVITGLDVIALQALEQFVLYTGVRPSDEQVRAAVEYARTP